MASKLRDHLAIPEEKEEKSAAGKRAKENDANEENGQKSKKARTGPTEDYSKEYDTKGKGKEQTAMSSKQKALAKSASGTKNIMSFFGKKA